MYECTSKINLLIHRNKSMMKRLKLLLTLFILMLFIGVRGQVWAPEGAEWYYDASYFMQSAYIHIKYVKDTLIHDTGTDTYKNCKVLEKIRHYKDTSGQPLQYVIGYEYTYNDENAVYLYKENTFYKLYDFLAEVGDSWTIPAMWDIEEMEEGTTTVMSKGTMEIDNQLLRYIELKTPMEDGIYTWNLSGIIVEGIGNTTNYLFPQSYTCPDEGGRFRCYDGSNISFSTGIVPSCNYIDVKDVMQNKQQIYPNPARNTIKITLPTSQSYHFTLQNIDGEIVKQIPQVTNGSKLSVDNIPTGIYIVTLDNGKHKFQTKLTILK